MASVRLDSPSKQITLILFLAAVLRLAFFPFFEGDDGDWTGRTLTAYEWLQNPYMIEGTTPWPVLNYLIPAAAIKVSGELFWSVRIMYLLLALSNVYLIFLLVRELFDERTALISALIWAVNPFHIRCSLNGAMSEPAYVSFVLLALWFSVRYRQTYRVSYLVGAGVAINLATMLRFDAVLWGAIAGYLILVPKGRILPQFTRQSPWLSVVMLGLLCAIYPIVLAVIWQHMHGDPLHVFHIAQLNTGQFFEAGRHPRFSPWLYQSYTVAFWPLSSFLILTPLVAGLAFVGLAYAVIRREHAELGVAYALFAAWLMYSAYRHTILSQFRYTLILQILLSAYFLLGVKQLLRSFPSLSSRAVYACCWIVGIATWLAIVSLTFMDAGTISRQIRALSPIQPASYASRSAVTWIREHVKPGESVLVMPEVQSPYLSLAARDLVMDGRIRRLSIYRPDGVLVYTKAELVNVFVQRVMDSKYVLSQAKYTSLGLQDGLITGVLSLPAGGAESFEQHNLRFDPIATFSLLSLYRPTSAPCYNDPLVSKDCEQTKG